LQDITTINATEPYRINSKADGASDETVIKRNMKAAIGKADYKRIRHCEVNGEILRPWHTAAIHDRTKGLIRRTVSRRYAGGPTIVLTHHGAIADISQPGYEDSPTHASYTSDQTDIMHEYSPDMWLFGHIHHTFERKVGQTKVACNPRGYSYETTGFRWDLVHTV